jgi:hypothetical protein
MVVLVLLLVRKSLNSGLRAYGARLLNLSTHSEIYSVLITSSYEIDQLWPDDLQGWV